MPFAKQLRLHVADVAHNIADTQTIRPCLYQQLLKIRFKPAHFFSIFPFQFSTFNSQFSIKESCTLHKASTA